MSVENVSLRQFEERDVPLRAEWMTHQVVRSGLNLSGIVDVESTTKWFRRVDKMSVRQDFVLEHHGSPVGMGGLTDISASHSRAELYAFVSPARMGEGFGTSLVSSLCGVGFGELGLQRIFLWMFGSNAAASHLYRKTGFLLEGVLRNHAFKDGVFVDRHVLGILRDDWISSNHNV